MKLKDDWLFLTIKDKNKIVAFLAGCFDCGTFWSDWIGVDSEYRNKGLGKSLKLELERILVKKKIHKIWCHTRVVNKEAISLNSGLRYNKIAQLTNHWYKEDFYLWEKNLE